MKRMRAIFGFGLAVLAAGAAAAQPPAFDPRPWLADYAAIKAGMARHYANLDSRLESLRVDPTRLDQAILKRLEAARSDLEAYDTLRTFVELFDDPHLQFKFGPARSPIETGLVSTAPPLAGASCADAGYEERKTALAPRMESLPGWRQVGDGAFPHGVAGTVGVVRIASFMETDYAAACGRAFRPGIDVRALQLATRAELQKDLAAAIAALKAAGATRLLIDLTGNGGGTEWDREAATLFTSRALTRRDARIADAQCDRSAVWTGEPPCDVFRDAGEEVQLQGIGAWTGPVSILANRHTASAAEEFVGWLVDNDAAVLVGEKTMGAGCGYVDGGNPVALKAAPVTLAMPNCARFTRDGVNEIEGWTPARALAFPDKGAEKAWGEALVKLLGA